MPEYKCPRCNYKTKIIKNIKTHFEKKIMCDVEEGCEDIDVTDRDFFNNFFNICIYCNKTSKTKLQKHYETCKEYLKNNNSVLNLQRQINILSKELENIKNNTLINNINNINTNTNSHNTNNINNGTINNIILNNYNAYSIKHIIKDNIDDFIQESINNGIINNLKTYFFELIFYNERAPENHSILIYKRGDVQHFFTHDNNELVEIHKDKLFNFIDTQVYDTVINILDNHVIKNENNVLEEFNELLRNYQIELKYNKKLEYKLLLEMMEEKNNIVENTHIDLMELPQYKNRYPEFIKKRFKNILSTFDQNKFKNKINGQ